MDLGFAVLLAFFILFVLGFPVVFAILIPSIAYIAWEAIPLATVAQRVLYALDSFPLVAVPVFIFVGNLMNAAGITEKIYHFANTLAGRLPGGLAQVNIVGSLIFSGVSGAALADVGGIGRIEIKAMKDEGFPVPFAAALTGASAIVGPIFPPSIPVIIYAAATSISAIQLLVAGIIPALICVVMLMIATAIVAMRRGYPRSARWPTLRELWNSFWPASPALFAPVILVGGMLSGYFTPTEASAVCVAYILFIGIGVLSRDDVGIHLQGRGRHGAHVGRRPHYRRRGGHVRLDPRGRAGAAGIFRMVQGPDHQSADDAARRQHHLLHRRHVHRFDNRYPATCSDRRAAGGRGRRRSDPSRHGRHLQPDDRNDHTAIRAVTVSLVQHDRRVDDQSPARDDPVLSAAADHARDPDPVPGGRAVDSHDAAMTHV